MKYIDADRLIDKILQLQKEYALTEVKEDNKAMRAVLGGQCYTLMEVVKIIQSLQDEQPEVDLKEETKEWVNLMVGASFPEQDGDFISEEDYRSVIRQTALHFYELGKNSK